MKSLCSFILGSMWGAWMTLLWTSFSYSKSIVQLEWAVWSTILSILVIAVYCVGKLTSSDNQ